MTSICVCKSLDTVADSGKCTATCATAASGLCHLNVNRCRIGPLETTDAVILLMSTVWLDYMHALFSGESFEHVKTIVPAHEWQTPPLIIKTTTQRGNY